MNSRTEPASRALSLIIPVYKNEATIEPLLEAVSKLNDALSGRLEVVFVVDGSPDRSYPLLQTALPKCTFDSQLCLLARNFGSFAAIRAGLQLSKGELFAVMAADLQEPPELIIDFFGALETEDIDVVLGQRAHRRDPWLQRMAAQLFWSAYRRFVQPEMPAGGVDVFACNRKIRDSLLTLAEANSSLVGLLVWLGHRRKLVPYERRVRVAGKSAWTFGKRLRYLADSAFAFSDLPVRALLVLGGVGMTLAVALGCVVAFERLTGQIQTPGYAATALLVMFFSSLNLLSLGVIGSYVWRAFENTKGRPLSLVLHTAVFSKATIP